MANDKGAGEEARRVDKPWGHELIWAHTDRYVGKIISIDPGRQRISLSLLDERGAVIGSEDAVDGSVIDEVIEQNSGNQASTNLGNLFKRALSDD